MIRIFTLLFSFFMLFCVAAVCTFLVLWDAQMVVTISNIFSHLAVTLWGKTVLAALGLIGLGCSLSLLSILLGLEPGANPHIILESEAGAVGVSVDAVEEFVKRKGETVRGVRDLQVRAEIEEGGLVIRNRIVLELQRNIPEFIHEFQSLIHRELTFTLGLQNIKEVKVLIHKIFPKDSSKEQKLLSGPQTVLLKQNHNDDDEYEHRREDGITVITPKEFREKDGSA